MRVIGYIRVSTNEQALSVEAQRQRLELEAELRGWSIKFIVDEGVSGARAPSERIGLSEAMGMLASGEANAIAVTKLDRIARSLADISRLLELSKEQEWGLIALDLGVDTSTPEGQLIVGILGAIAQWERARIQERITEALAIAKQNGKTLGRPPRYGAETAERVREMREAGATWEAISLTLAAAGVRTRSGTQLSHSQLRSLVRRV
jgi:DNA invertase Pin-like site-specific DNA recombinase